MSKALKVFTYKDIKSWDPCYNPSKYIDKNWKGTIIDILNLDNMTFEDKIWVVLRTELISDKVMRLFAVWAYRQCLEFTSPPDPRSINATNIAEQYALGNATKEELKSAEESAWAAWDTALSARLAAESSSKAVWSAAVSAESAARSAARCTDESATKAAWSAARCAWYAESFGARIPWSIWSDAQKQKLVEMVLGDLE